VSGQGVWETAPACENVRAMPADLLETHLVRVSPGAALGTIRVEIAHGRRLVRAGLRLLLEQEAGIDVVEAVSGDQAVAVARSRRPDVVLMDVDLPGLGCVEATRRILTGRSRVEVVVLAVTETDPIVFAALKAGAAGLLLEDREPAALVRAIRRLGRESRVRARGLRPAHPLREIEMLTPKVTEIRRGCAHASAAAPPKPGVTPAA
jgi:DNA-binding NarL/FixJ family response regulator